jgi:DNA-directed RNA polymerase subunit L
MNMNPTIVNMTDGEDSLEFTLKGVDVSIANAIRRTLLSDIPTVVFRTFGEQKDSVFTVNTSRLNNEILGQRLSCIPIHLMPDGQEDINDLLLEVDEVNETDTIRTITTKDFKIKRISTGEYLTNEHCREIFKPYISPTGDEYYIQFVRLRQRISPEIPGEHIAFTCKFSIGYAFENSMFNVVGTCAYGMSVDEDKAEELLAVLMQTWDSSGTTADTIEHDADNWRLLEKKRIVLANSFDFIIKTVGPIPSGSLVAIACAVLIGKFKRIIADIEGGIMVSSNSSMSNNDSVEYTLENEDYTIGNVLNHLMFKKYYEGNKTLSFCGFKKMHPHDTHSVIRLMFSDIDIVPDYPSFSPPDGSPHTPSFSPPGGWPANPQSPTFTPPGGWPEQSPGYKQSGGGATDFNYMGFRYITECCKDAIVIFESIQQLF